MKGSLRRALAAWLLAMGIPAALADTPPTITVGLEARQGAVDGFLQTPAGGNPGSSSLRRPALQELGIDHMTQEDGFAAVQWQQFSIHAGYQPMTLQGQSVLRQPLTSHSLAFPAGDAVALSTTLDWWHIGAGWTFHADDGRLAITPSAGLAMLALDYRLSDRTQTAKRRYSKGALRAGLDLRYAPVRQVSLVAGGAVSWPLRNAPRISTFRAGVELRPLPGSPACQPILFVGGSSQSIDYEDRQTLPNHLRIHTGLLPTVALSVAF